jgi:hypothetical protein
MIDGSRLMPEDASKILRMVARRFLLAVSLAIALTGCSAMGRTAEVAASQSNMLRSDRISIEELDHLTRGFADRYSMVVGSAVDLIKRNNSDATERRIAHRIKLDGVLAVNDIVSGDDPYAEVLDLTVAVTLQSLVWIDENRANTTFGDRAPVLIRALHAMRREAWELAARVMTQAQLELLDLLILEWRRDHRDVEQVAFVKFNDFAGARAASLLVDLQSGGGMLAPLRETNVELRETRRLAERAFWYGKRGPSIAGIEAEAATNEILAAPEIGRLLATVEELSRTAARMGRMVESLPQSVARERHQIFLELDQRQKQVAEILSKTSTLAEQGSTLARDATRLATALQQTLLSLDQTLKGADAVASKYYVPGPSSSEAPGKPFDITEYQAALDRTQEIVSGLNQLATNASAATGLTAAADQRIEGIFNKIYVTIGLVLLSALVYRAVARYLLQV